MRVLFVYPHTLGHGDVPIALTVLSAVLRRAGHQVKVFDCSFYANNDYVQSMKELYGMVRLAPKPPVEAPPTKDILDLRQDFAAIIKAFNPHIVGVTCSTAIYPLGLECAQMAKMIDSGIKTIFGGVHPTLCSEEVISEKAVDFVCVGEGEEALVELCDALDHKKPVLNIRNIWLKDLDNPGQIISNEPRPFLDMNTLPAQNYQDFAQYSLYRPFDGKIYKMLHTEFSRGCVFNCFYCANHALREMLKSSGRYHRCKDPAVAIEHIKEMVQKYGFNFIRIWDEDFTGHPVDYLKDIAVLYKKDIGLPFLVYADTRSVTKEKVMILKDMGCITMAIGIESGNYWMRRYVLNRNITNEEIIRKFEIAKKSGIRISTYNMIGLPFETREMVFETIRLNRQVDVTTSTVGPFKPFPKTRLGDIARQFGMIMRKPDFLTLESEMCTPYIDDKEIDGLVRTFAYYLKLPEDMFPILELCEKDEKLAKQLLPHLIIEGI